MNTRAMVQAKPQWVQALDRLNRQPDLLDAAHEAVRYVRGAMAMLEHTEDMDAYEEAKRTLERLEGAIAKESAKRTGRAYLLSGVPYDITENEDGSLHATQTRRQ